MFVQKKVDTQPVKTWPPYMFNVIESISFEIIIITYM